MGHKHKTWSAAMSVGRSVFVDVLHKIDNADKVTDNVLSLIRILYHFIASMSTFFFL